MQRFLLFLIICCTSCTVIMSIYQPPYQVMLFVRQENSFTQKMHYCNGIIVQRRLILTTATCVHIRNEKNNTAKLMDIHNIEIIAGSSSRTHEPIVVSQARSIYLAQGFNMTSRSNDLALISLKNTLPLGFRDDIKWIILDDTGIKVGKGLTYFTYSNCYNRVKGNMEMTEVKILDSKVCNLRNLYSTELCSYYKLSDELDCEDFSEFLHHFGDRGTGLIQNSCLVAILSEIAPHLKHKNQNTSESCSSTFMNASYTAIAPHVEWIYYVIAYEEHIDIIQAQNQVSTPYHTRDIQPIYSAQCIETTEKRYTTKKPRKECEDHDAEISGLASQIINQSNYANTLNLKICLLLCCLSLMYRILKDF